MVLRLRLSTAAILLAVVLLSLGHVAARAVTDEKGPLGEVLPAAMFDISFFEVQLWQWVGLLLLVVAAWALARVGVWVLRAAVRPFVRRTRSDVDDRLLDLAKPPLTLALALIVFTLGTYVLRLSGPAYGFLAGLEKALAVIAVTWIVFRVVDIFSAVADERLERAGRKTAAAVIPLARRAAKVFLVAMALIGVLQNLGWNVTGLIAGLGVGGIAFALAAQKSIENLFGGVTLIADQPVRVGDFCRFGSGKLGTVEAIGLRSTRIRTLDRTVVTVPNSQFSEIQLESFAPRDRIRLSLTLGLRYETTPDQLRWILAELRRILIAHPGTTDSPSRVRFVAFGPSSLDLEIFTYVTTSDWEEYCAIREDLYLRFMDAVDRSGSGFAFPSQTLYLGRDPGLDSERSRAAEAEVDGLRREGRLPFPDFSGETIDELAGSGHWPPRGSVARPTAGPGAPGAEESA